ncbi:MAG: hypothetical protein GTN76_17005 [Candidatus Aenigmarchaeota archaeon]|nr:hypothetical protein [Candidatus Aenigmarchaeota archaeon]
MKKILFVMAIIMVFLVSCSTGPAVQRQPLPLLPRSSPETTPQELEVILNVHNVGKAEVDLSTNELILTTFRKGQGGMRVNLFSDYTRVLIQSFVYDEVIVSLEDFKIYVVTIAAEDSVGMVTFQMKYGRLFIR